MYVWSFQSPVRLRVCALC
uniref:Uncharacterized protein n=1 Tax=Anguilla anguilla TaxID=7936 RepID=A0A0E9XVD7_ANGAN